MPCQRTGVRSACGDAGVATLELTVLFPVVLLIVFGVIQGALYFHGRNAAMAAAEQGVRRPARTGRATGRAPPPVRPDSSWPTPASSTT